MCRLVMLIPAINNDRCDKKFANIASMQAGRHAGRQAGREAGTQAVVQSACMRQMLVHNWMQNG